MSTVALVVVYAVAALHVYILVLEMFLWTGPIGRRAFALSPEMAAQTKSLAANQGLYNGFLAAGLIWGALTDQRPVVLFFLACVAVAGVFGAITVNKRILFVQALPSISPHNPNSGATAVVKLVDHLKSKTTIKLRLLSLAVSKTAAMFSASARVRTGSRT